MRFRVILSLLFLLVVASSAFADDPALYSQGLKQRIDFWKKVYVQYGADDVIIHDRIYVNLIYGVATEATCNAKTEEIRNALREIRSNLEKPTNLSPAAVSVFAAIVAQRLPISSRLIDDLSANIHRQIGVKERFREGVIRSGRYVEKFREIMKDHGVPTDLALLPLVESSFQNAKSKSGAVGIWQFTSGTGKLYMKITNKLDERLDAFRSAEAAAHCLLDNYRVLGTWPLAITAYNHGRQGMSRAQKHYGSDLPTIIDRYQGPVFGYASMNFYSEFLAAVEVYNNYPQYFGELTLDRPYSPPCEGPTMRASNLPEKRANTSAKSAAAVVAARYKVQNGDTLSAIAQRFGMTIRNLMARNKLNSPVIHAGQILLIKQSVRRHHRRSGRNSILSPRL